MKKADGSEGWNLGSNSSKNVKKVSKNDKNEKVKAFLQRFRILSTFLLLFKHFLAFFELFDIPNSFLRNLLKKSDILLWNKGKEEDHRDSYVKNT